MRRLAVENFDWLATRAAVSQFDLTEAQKTEFRATLTKLSLELRSQQLGNILSLLRRIPKVSDQTAVRDLMSEIDGTWQKLAGSVCMAFAPMASALTSAQVSHFRGKLAEKNDKYDPEKQGGLAAYRERKRADARENAKEWFGKLTAAQETLLDERSAPPPVNGDGAEWERSYLEYRLESQDAFLGLMAKGDPAEFERKCRSFARDPGEFLSPEARKIKARLKEHRDQTTMAFLASLDPEQRLHFTREMERLAGDLEAWGNHLKR